MRVEDAGGYRHPATGAAFELRVGEAADGVAQSGVLVSDDGETPIVRGIPRFCPEENYAESFGFQWVKYSETQLDSKAGWGEESARRLFGESGWPRDMSGERILEAGSGMGRFTEVLARSGADVWSFDYSQAVEANERNNGGFPNVHLAQADIFNPPYPHESFDRVLCIGVLQHTPSPEAAFKSLVRFLKPGGEIFVDVYRLSWRSFLLGKYYLRPITRRLSPQTLDRFVRLHVGWVFPFTGWLQQRIGRRGRSVSWALAMADYRGLPFVTDEEKARELSILDTLDMLAPAYDRPKTLGTVRRWFAEAGLAEVNVRPGYNGIAAGGRRPAPIGIGPSLFALDGKRK